MNSWGAGKLFIKIDVDPNYAVFRVYHDTIFPKEVAQLTQAILKWCRNVCEGLGDVCKEMIQPLNEKIYNFYLILNSILFTFTIIVFSLFTTRYI